MITVRLSLYGGSADENVRLFKDVEWPSVPPEGAWLQVSDADGAPVVGARVDRVHWDANGCVVVEARTGVQPVSGFAEVVKKTREAGFLDYGEWAKT